MKNFAHKIMHNFSAALSRSVVLLDVVKEVLFGLNYEADSNVHIKFRLTGGARTRSSGTSEPGSGNLRIHKMLLEFVLCGLVMIF